MASGYDISGSVSSAQDQSARSATGAIGFGPVTITNLGTGANSVWLMAAIGVAIWYFFIRKK